MFGFWMWTFSLVFILWCGVEGSSLCLRSFLSWLPFNNLYLFYLYFAIETYAKVLNIYIYDTLEWYFFCSDGDIIHNMLIYRALCVCLFAAMFLNEEWTYKIYFKNASTILGKKKTRIKLVNADYCKMIVHLCFCFFWV